MLRTEHRACAKQGQEAADLVENRRFYSAVWEMPLGCLWLSRHLFC